MYNVQASKEVKTMYKTSLENDIFVLKIFEHLYLYSRTSLIRTKNLAKTGPFNTFSVDFTTVTTNYG